ncbi:MAG TPA: CPBP family glutamic-type intramembrane protease [Anaerolineales bacterium]|nr:CPBP family glutamic-type intramembrane protease [Anaerolineales bacterium]
MADASLRKWLTPVLPYLAIGIGIFWFRNAWAALLGFHGAILLSLVLARSQFPLKTLFKSNNVRWVLLSIILSGSGGIFLYLFWSSFGIVSELSRHIAALGLNSSGWITFIAYFSLTNPFVEEYFWRGYLGSPTKNLYISDFIYAGFHAMILIRNVKATSIIYSLIVLVLASWFWRQITREDGGLLAPVLGHMAADFTILITIYWMSM